MTGREEIDVPGHARAVEVDCVAVAVDRKFRGHVVQVGFAVRRTEFGIEGDARVAVGAAHVDKPRRCEGQHDTLSALLERQVVADDACPQDFAFGRDDVAKIMGMNMRRLLEATLG